MHLLTLLDASCNLSTTYKNKFILFGILLVCRSQIITVYHRVLWLMIILNLVPALWLGLSNPWDVHIAGVHCSSIDVLEDELLLELLAALLIMVRPVLLGINETLENQSPNSFAQSL